MSAVSSRVMPNFSAWWINATASSSLFTLLVYVSAMPMLMHPRPMADTVGPLRPSLRYCMSLLLPINCRGGKHRHPLHDPRSRRERDGHERGHDDLCEARSARTRVVRRGSTAAR